MSKLNAILIRANVYDKKDNKGKGLSLDLLANYENINDIKDGKVVNMFAGSAYQGGYDFSSFKRFEEVEIEYNQPLGSQYAQLVNVKKIIRK